MAGLTRDFTLATSPGKKDLYLKADNALVTALFNVFILPGSENSPLKNLSSCLPMASAAFFEAPLKTLELTPAPAPAPAPYAAPVATFPKSKSSKSFPCAASSKAATPAPITAPGTARPTSLDVAAPILAEALKPAPITGGKTPARIEPVIPCATILLYILAAAFSLPSSPNKSVVAKNGPYPPSKKSPNDCVPSVATTASTAPAAANCCAANPNF